MPLVDLLNALLWAGRNGLPPTPDTLNLGCSYYLHSSHRFLSTWGAVMLETNQNKTQVKDTQFEALYSQDHLAQGGGLLYYIQCY